MEIKVFVNGYCDTDTYILSEGNKAVVVDPADAAEEIINIVKSVGAEIVAVLVTHCHFDHIGAVKALQALGAKVYASADYELIHDLNRVFMRDTEMLEFTPDVVVSDGQAFELIGHSFKVISTPGHTPFGVCYIMDDEIIFSGDTLFRMSVGRTDLYGGNYEKLLASVKSLVALPHDYDVLPGHGESTTLDFERRNNPYVHF